MRYQSYLNVIWYKGSNIRAPEVLNLLNSLRKNNKMLGKPRISSFFLNLFS